MEVVSAGVLSMDELVIAVVLSYPFLFLRLLLLLLLLFFFFLYSVPSSGMGWFQRGY